MDDLSVDATLEGEEEEEEEPKEKVLCLGQPRDGKNKGERERGGRISKVYTHTTYTHTTHSTDTQGLEKREEKKQNKTTPVCFFLETCTCSAVVNDGNERLTAGRVRSYVF